MKKKNIKKEGNEDVLVPGGFLALPGGGTERAQTAQSRRGPSEHSLSLQREG